MLLGSVSLLVYAQHALNNIATLNSLWAMILSKKKTALVISLCHLCQLLMLLS